MLVPLALVEDVDVPAIVVGIDGYCHQDEHS
jgi:hypothetical protein